MKRVLPFVAVVAAAALLGAAAWLLIGPGAPRTTAPSVPAPEPVPAPPPPESAPVFAPGEPDPEPAPAAGEDAEPPIPPDAYPWEVPGWWHEIDRKFRDTMVAVDGESLAVARVLERVSAEVNFPVRVGPELESWAADSRLTLTAVRTTARAVVEGVARQYNLEAVLKGDALVLHRRGRAPKDRLTDAGRVQWALAEARERHAGAREPDLAAAGLEAMRVEFPLDGVPLREAARRLAEKIGVPVYMDAPLWNVNPVVRIAEGTRTLGDVLDRMTTPWQAAFDVTPRRVVLFRP